jgi:hypothetical protein
MTLSLAPETFTFRGPWFSAREAQLYVPCKSIKAWYEWRRKHGIIARSNGSVAKADLDRELARRKPRRVMAAASLANLQKRRAG